MKDSFRISRRKYLDTSIKSTIALSVLPGLACSRTLAPSDKLNIAAIGVGGIGKQNLQHFTSENIVALCDVDWEYAAPVFQQFPQAKKFRNYRKMFDKMDKSIDAVFIATPDHTHAVIAAEAMRRGKHVYCQKPLSHSIYESRVLAKLAEESKVATQMGNQGHSSMGVQNAIQWLQEGAIGDVTHVEAWTDRPLWYQGIGRPSGNQPVPDSLSWDLFLGPAKWRPYNRAYTPFQWRAWWDFGTGSLGDMAGHVLDLPFIALKLGNPEYVYARTRPVTTECYPTTSIVHYEFPDRGTVGQIKLRPLKLTFYDSGIKPPIPSGLNEMNMPGADEGGVILTGTKGKMITNCFGCDPVIISNDSSHQFTPSEPRYRIVQDAVNGGHEKDWLRACKEEKESRTECYSNFKKAAVLTELSLIGNLAIRFQSFQKRLKWDSDKMDIVNINDNDTVEFQNIDLLTGYNSYPHIERHMEKINAKKTLNEMIRHTYRDGWEL